MTTNPRYAKGSARRKLRGWLAAQDLPCHLCGRPIDYDLPARDPWAFEVDELVPVSLGGDPYDPGNVAPAHRICNQRRGNRSVEQARRLLRGQVACKPEAPGAGATADQPRPRTTRDW